MVATEQLHSYITQKDHRKSRFEYRLPKVVGPNKTVCGVCQTVTDSNGRDCD
jgi:hypothetical protein